MWFDFLTVVLGTTIQGTGVFSVLEKKNMVAVVIRKMKRKQDLEIVVSMYFNKQRMTKLPSEITKKTFPRYIFSQCFAENLRSNRSRRHTKACMVEVKP